MASLDRDWHIGVCGWTLDDGRHVRLAEVLALAGPEERERLVEEHRNACVWLWLVQSKLHDELAEALP